MDKLFEPCEHLNFLQLSESSETLLPTKTVLLFTSDDPGNCFTLACVKARESI